MQIKAIIYEMKTLSTQLLSKSHLISWLDVARVIGPISETTGRGMQGRERAGNAGVTRDYKSDCERKPEKLGEAEH